MNAFRPHHLDPRLETARVALVCRDWTVGDRSAKLLALENQMIAMGLWPSMFASS
jgi:hypothetical protein